MIYAYHNGRFWRWDEGRSIWKESHLMAQKFERARAALKTLTPEAFFSDGAEFALLDEYEISLDMAEALRIAKPCKNAPIDPVEEGSECTTAPTADAAATMTSPAASSSAAANPMTETAVVVQSSAALDGADESTPAPSSTAPSFDYSVLDAQTVDVLHMAEGQYVQGKRMTETGLRWMVNAVCQAARNFIQKNQRPGVDALPGQRDKQSGRSLWPAARENTARHAAGRMVIRRGYADRQSHEPAFRKYLHERAGSIRQARSAHPLLYTVYG